MKDSVHSMCMRIRAQDVMFVAVAVGLLLVNCTGGAAIPEAETIPTLNPGPSQTVESSLSTASSSFGMISTPFPTPMPNPCQPPCWYNIVPGETSMETAREIVDSLPIVRESWIPDYGEHYPGFQWSMAMPGNSLESSRADGVIWERGHTVDLIGFYHPYPYIRAGDLLAQYGEPKAVGPRSWGVEAVFFEVTFWYPEKGLFFEIRGTYDHRGPCLSEDGVVTWAAYTVPGSLEDVFPSVFRQRHSQSVFDELRDWPGFGCSFYED